MELPVHILIRLLDTLHILHNIHGLDRVHVYLGCVPYEPYDSLFCPFDNVDIKVFLPEPGDQ